MCETERLRIRRWSLDDAGFILRLLNEPSFIRHVADKGVRTLDDARAYLLNGPLASYARHGFGLGMVELKATGEAIGMCGLIRRDVLEEVDIGYAFLPEFWSRGYAVEAVHGVLGGASHDKGLQRVLAVVSPDNSASIRVLEIAGFRYERMIKLGKDEQEVRLFSRELAHCRRLGPDHAHAYRALMLQAYALHPDAFTSSVAEREALPLAWWQTRLSTVPDALDVVFGAFDGGVLVGAAGLTFDTREKARHKATLFGMVVSAAHRRLGLGQQLVAATLDYARSRPGVQVVQLTVTQGNAQAQALYARNGFVEFGVEPYAVALSRGFVSKVHMWHRL